MNRKNVKPARAAVTRIAVVVVALCSLCLPAAVGADTGPSLNPIGSHGPLGVVPAFGPGGAAQAGLPAPPRAGDNPGAAANRFAGTNNLTWHNGPVMHTNRTYTIFWSPGSTIGQSYIDTINRFFGDVAADSGTFSNVYATDPQYTDATGAAQYSSTFGATWVDTGTPIPDHCSSAYSGSGITVHGCVLDSDIQSEVSRAMTQNGWSGGLGAQFFVFTPKNVGSCTDSTLSECAFTYYCAYHWYFGSGSSPSIYANMPYAETLPAGCGSGQSPNGNDADSTINVTSHEHNEAITDPLGNAWYDALGYENGDKCAWNFGGTLGGTSGSAYNQVINGNDYYLQMEWNNASSSCVQRLPGPPPSISGFSPTSGPAGTSVTITGTGFTGATAVKFNGTGATFTVTGDTQITTTVPANATSGPISVTTPGGTATSSTSFSVPAPDFTVGVSPSSQTVTRGQSTQYTVGVTGNNGWVGTVQLSASGLPGGTSASFSPGTVATGGTSTLTVKTKNNTRRGTYTVTVAGTSGGVKRTATVTLTVA